MSTVTLSNTTAEAIGHALAQDVYPVENADRMAWLVLLLKKCEDRSEWFPRGKFASPLSMPDWIADSDDDETIPPWFNDTGDFGDNDPEEDEDAS